MTQMAPKPPAHLCAYVEVLGVDEAIRFLLTFGGGDIYYANDPKGNSALAKAFGLDVARKMGRRANAEGWPRRVPLGKKWIAQVLITRGLPVAEVSRKLHMADTTVRDWTKPQRDDRQLSLFSDD